MYIFLAVFFLFFIAWIKKEPGPRIYQVVRIIDGDSIIVKNRNNIFELRLAGIDAPEMPNQPFAKEAKTYLYELLMNKKIEAVHSGIDRYDRLLSEITYNKANVNILMIRMGLAQVYTGKTHKKVQIHEYINAEMEAHQNKRGIWSNANKIDPSVWRKLYG